MNIKALIKKYEAVECVVGIVSGKTILKTVLKDLKQLDEPQPVKVPQFVADWIEVCKEHLTTSLYTAMNPDFMKENNQSFDFILWIKKTSNQDLFARAWLDGYEVEEEKRYEVMLRNGQSLKTVYRQGGDHLDFEMVYGDLESFTRKAIRRSWLRLGIRLPRD